MESTCISGLIEYLDVKQAFRNVISGTLLVVQWLRLCVSNTRDTGSIPGYGIKIQNALQQGQDIYEMINMYI